MRPFRFSLIFLLASAAWLPQWAGAAPKLPQLSDPALHLEALVTVPEIEAPTTVCSDPGGAFYVGCDPRDTRLNTENPECSIVRFSGFGADRQRTIFADKLYSPAGSLWLDGWLYVIHDPFLSRFRDTDADGVADQREDLISNLGVRPQTGMNDHCASGLVLGMDGYLYLSIGDRGSYRTVGRDGSGITLQGGGIVRCRPDGTALEVVSRGTRNHLSVLLDAEDNAFTRDNTDDGNGWWTRLTHHIGGGSYGYPYDYRGAANYGVTQPSLQTLAAVKQHGGTAVVDGGSLRVDEKASARSTFLPAMTDFGAGSPTGGLCYLSDGLPEKYRGKLLFSEWGKQALFVTEVARDGATFRWVKEEPLLQGGKDAAFRPLEVCVAQDGSVLIADWGWGGWKAPKREGVVWRLSWPEGMLAPRVFGQGKRTVQEAVTTLWHPDRGQRLAAEYWLQQYVEGGRGSAQGQADATALASALQAVAEAPAAATLPRLHALGLLGWLQNLDFAVTGEQPDFTLTFRERITELFTRTLADRDPAIREHTLRAMASFEIGKTDRSSLPAFRGNSFLASLDDSEPRVRLAAAQLVERTAAPRADPEALTALVPLLTDADAWVRWTALHAMAAIFQNMQDCCGQQDESAFYAAKLLRHPQPAIRQAAWQALELDSLWGNLPMLDDFLATKDSDLRLRAVRAAAGVAYQRKPWDGHWWGTQPVKGSPPLPDVAWEGTKQVVGLLAGALADADPALRLAAAQGFADFLLDPADPGTSAALGALRGRLEAESDAGVRQQLIESLGVQKDPEAMPVFTEIALQESADPGFRATAIAAVVRIGGPAARETIARLAEGPLSPVIRRGVIEAAGTLRVAAAAPALITQLRVGEPGDRLASVQALAAIGVPAQARDALIAALADADAKVQTAAVVALGQLQDHAALPALLEFWKTKRARKELLNALAAMPDAQALPILTSALAENSPSTRRNLLLALTRMSEDALPLIEQKLASGEIPPEFAPEIYEAFNRGVLCAWQVIGPFENVWASEHGPEADARAGTNPLTRHYVNALNQEAHWQAIEAAPETGQVDLAKFFKNRGMVCAYAGVEIQAPKAFDTKLRCGSNDQIAIWLNGRQVHDFAGTRAFVADQDTVPVHFAAGKNVLLIKIGNVEGDWQFAVRLPKEMPSPLAVKEDVAPDRKQRDFALATRPDGTWEHAGDPATGERIFRDPTGPLGGLCATCHLVRGQGGQIGPDLSSIGTNYRRPELIASIQQPSQTIALGYEQVVVEQKNGDSVVGALRQESNESLSIVGPDGQAHVVQKSDVVSQKALPISLMPAGLTLSLKAEEFTDLLAYLESLRGP